MKINISIMGVLWDTYFLPAYDSKKRNFWILDILDKYPGRTGLSDHFMPIFIDKNPTEAATIRLWSARWRHFQPIRARLSRNPLSRNTPNPLYIVF